MEDLKQDVNTEESSTPEEEQEEQVVTEQATDQPEGESTETQEAQPEADSKPPAYDESMYDENGVPWKNRAMEYRRKTEELVDKLPTLLEEAISKKEGKPQYTRDQLESFREQNIDNPQYTRWANDEIRKLEKLEIQQLTKEEISRFKQEQENIVKRQQANSYTVNKYPDAFLRGINGQYVVDKGGDPIPNQQHPVGRMMAGYLGDPDLQRRPDKLYIASKLAYADYIESNQGKTMKQQQKLKEEVGSLQKKTLTEGSGKSAPQPIPVHRKALDKLKQSGKIDDAKLALDALLKAHQKE